MSPKKELLKLLFVEDEEETRENIVNYLKNLYQLEFHTASNGLEAWNIYLEKKPEIVITDIQMEHINGLELVEKIREINSHTKIVVISAYSEKEKLLKAVKLNLVDYLIKPLSRKDINDTLSNIINSINSVSDETNKIYFDKSSYFDLKDKNLFLNNQIIKLSKKEIDFLELLGKNKNTTISTDSILNTVWDHDNASIESLRTFIKKLRKKLPKDTIETTYGGGYKLSTLI